jgi:hypothetical protein
VPPTNLGQAPRCLPWPDVTAAEDLGRVLR